MAGTVRLRHDMEWLQEMPVKDRILFGAVAGWLMMQYGYK